jgi:hypothetical protein
MEPGSVAIDPGNAAMAAAWDGEDGEHWLTWAALYDRAVSRHHDPLLAAARIAGLRTGDDDHVPAGQVDR